MHLLFYFVFSSSVRTTETRWKTANIDDGGVCVRETEEPNNGG